MGGTKYRMKEFAKYIAKLLKYADDGLVNLTKHSHRYAMYKVGPVLSVNVRNPINIKYILYIIFI